MRRFIAVLILLAAVIVGLRSVSVSPDNEFWKVIAAAVYICGLYWLLFGHRAVVRNMQGRELR